MVFLHLCLIYFFHLFHEVLIIRFEHTKSTWTTTPTSTSTPTSTVRHEYLVKIEITTKMAWLFVKHKETPPFNYRGAIAQLEEYLLCSTCICDNPAKGTGIETLLLHFFLDVHLAFTGLFLQYIYIFTSEKSSKKQITRRVQGI